MVSTGKATWVDLDTKLGVEDLYDLLEIIQVDAYNKRVIAENLEEERKKK